MNLKQPVLHLLRGAGLLEIADRVRFRWLAFRSRAGHSAFRRAHGGVPLPPDDLAYDAYGGLNWDFYWAFGRLIAAFFAQRMLAGSQTGRVLEWGCGPARIVRHLPQLLGSGWEVHGADANARTIAWCVEHLPAVRFHANAPTPPLPFAAGGFDYVYSVSVFTHLSADLHRRWADELCRVLKPGGILICTLHGDTTRPLLLPSERAQFDAGQLVVRGTVAEGTRCFLAYHPRRFVVEELLRDFDVVEQIPAPNTFGANQDVWIARKRAS